MLAGNGHRMRSPDDERAGSVRPGVTPQGVRPVLLCPGLRRGDITLFSKDRQLDWRMPYACIAGVKKEDRMLCGSLPGSRWKTPGASSDGHLSHDATASAEVRSKEYSGDAGHKGHLDILSL